MYFITCGEGAGQPHFERRVGINQRIYRQSRTHCDSKLALFPGSNLPKFCDARTFSLRHAFSPLRRMKPSLGCKVTDAVGRSGVHNTRGYDDGTSEVEGLVVTRIMLGNPIESCSDGR